MVLQALLSAPLRPTEMEAEMDNASEATDLTRRLPKQEEIACAAEAATGLASMRANNDAPESRAMVERPSG